jgi:hypothetical protein
MAKTARQAESIVSMKVTLRGIRPPIWRRLLLPGRMTLGDLHHVIQAAMGWDDGHLHAFDIAGRQYSDPLAVDDVADEERLTVNGVLRSGVSRFTYTYDFGDDWEHEIMVEDLLDADTETHYPSLVAAKGACPPEDCGGPWGYAELKEILADPSHERHQEVLDWLGLDDSSAFDPNAIATDHIEQELALSGASG